ncbi:hypothetical protein K502DRAFT_348210 [Neoconidiobolus thromboides FSU 785]|nr:hypothetical protein K502DRAFT_348210 [Neoconidiobolus thromboides FSU 785]
MKENDITFDQTDPIIPRKPTAPRKRKPIIMLKFIPHKNLNLAFIPVVFNNGNSSTIDNNGVDIDPNNIVGTINDYNGFNGTMRGSNNNNNTIGANSSYNNSDVINNGYNVDNNKHGVNIVNNNTYDFSFDSILRYNTYDHNAYNRNSKRNNIFNSNVNLLYSNGLSFSTIDSNLNP